MKQRLAAIAARLRELEAELSTADAVRIDAISAEVAQLTTERSQITQKMADEARAAFAAGKPVEQPSPNGASDAEERRLSQMSKRDKLAYALGKKARGKKFSEMEQRALGVALTTTADTFVAATSELDGVNNAGVFIKTSMLLDFLREEKLLSPIVNDVAFTSVPGLINFPYRKSRDKARSKAEGVAGKDNQAEWDKLIGTEGNLQIIIAITDQVMALTDFNFGEYILSQIMQDLSEDWGEDLIYGTASDNHIKGVTYGATAAVASGYTGDVLTAVIAGIKACKGKFRRGAKLYVAQDVFDEIAFAVDDNGNFKHPVFNNPLGFSTIGPLRVETDEQLVEGDFLIGNVAKYFKANMLIPLRIETERKARYGITEYIASEYCATVPFPGAFIHGFKRA